MASKVVIKSAEWAAVDLPRGLTVEGGIISGKPTGSVGDYKVPVRVRTPWGEHTNHVTIHVRKHTILPVLKNGSEIAKLTVAELLEKITDGTAQTEYGIGTQIVVPYTDPFTKITYDCPFNFGTFRQFELEDGTTFEGLGLQSHYLLPTTSVQFDAPEPDSNIAGHSDYGSSSYMDSAIRQWMNSSGKDWWTSQHEYDVAPTEPANWATEVNGLLSCFPSDFVDALYPVKVVTKPSAFYGGLDTVYDKFFLLSTRETNITVAESTRGLSDDTEGAYWEYWRQTNNLNDYRASDTAFANGVQYNIENHEEAGISWLRSQYINDNSRVWAVEADGSVVATDSTFAGTARRIAPACVLAQSV